jgi:hypothetical protein
MLRAEFKMALRQIEGLMDSVLTLMNLTLSVPDHTAVSRRAVGLTVAKSKSVAKEPLHVLIDSRGLEVFGAGKWLEAKHGAKSRRAWRKLHLAVDADTGMIVAQVLTDQHTDDSSPVWPLLAQVDEEIRTVISVIQIKVQCGQRRGQHDARCSVMVLCGSAQTQATLEPIFDLLKFSVWKESR